MIPNREQQILAKASASVFASSLSVTRYWDDDYSNSVDIISCLDALCKHVTSLVTIGTYRRPVAITLSNSPISVEIVGACYSADASYVEYGNSRYVSMHNKSETFAVEAGNAELRHYLARLTHRSRCFSRCIDALRRAVKLFISAWNRRRLHNRAFPKYKAHVSDFSWTLD